MNTLVCVLVAGVALGLGGCGGAQYPDIDEPLPPGTKLAEPGPATAAPAPQESRVTPAGTLQRQDVERVVDAGLGRFLGQVGIEPSLSNGKFVGWSIVSLAPAAVWRDVDLKPGDVVTRVNGMAIEREMEAYDAFQAVRQAPSLEVSYLRRGQARTLRFAIIGAASLPPRQERPAPAGGSPSARPSPG
jgi:S1-C subfamily serine protease